jgi:Lrp/AsnC family leucine-responsive transcriptional regulator
LLDVLQDNSRLSFADLGRKRNRSPSAFGERTKKLEEFEVIPKYTLPLYNKKLGNDLDAFILFKFFPD